MTVDKAKWWLPRSQGGFFGKEYMYGDDSQEGPYCDRPMSLSQRTNREANSTVQLLGLTPEQLILDCPCGYGRHSLELARRGFRIIGVDLNPSYLEHAAQEKAALGISDTLLQLRQGDMRDIPLASNSVDAAINMFTSFGFFPKDEENLQVLKEFYRVLRSGGKVLIHLDYNPNSVKAGRWIYENHTRQLRGNAKLLVDETYDLDTQRIIGNWTLVDDSDSPNYESHYSLRVYSPDEYRTMLSECGFTEIMVLGDFEEPFEALKDDSLETVIKASKL